MDECKPLPCRRSSLLASTLRTLFFLMFSRNRSMSARAAFGTTKMFQKFLNFSVMSFFLPSVPSSSGTHCCVSRSMPCARAQYVSDVVSGFGRIRSRVGFGWVPNCPAVGNYAV